VIALTANVLPSDKQRCFQAGMDGYVAKPVNSGELFQTLASHLEKLASADAGISAPPEQPTGPAPLDAGDIPILPGIDTQTGLTQANHKPELYLKLLRNFRDKSSRDFESDYRLALDAEDWETATRRAHTLKGMTKTIGAFGIGQIAAELEKATRQQDRAAIPAILARLLPELAGVRAGLLGLESSRNQRATTTTDLATVLGRVLELLEQRDAGAADLLPTLRAALQSAGFGTEAEAVSEAIGHYNFPQAAKILKNLQESS
jgi:HPt (histidine-containing phosphotransfer) domain-containing protein